MTNETEKEDWRKYTEGIDSQFKCLRNAPKSWTVPFIPWCGEKYWNAETRILFVGKGVGAFNDPDAKLWGTNIHEWGNLDALKITADYMTSKVALFNTANSVFWVIPFLIAGVFSPVEMDPRDLAQSFAWSNVFKVCNSESDKGTQTKNGLPTSADRKCKCAESSKCGDKEEFCLFHKSAEWLVQEKKILKPDLILLGISDEWNKIGPALGFQPSNNFRFPIRLHQDEIKHLGLGYTPKGIWVTYHFSSWCMRTSKGRHGRLLLEMRKALAQHPVSK